MKAECPVCSNREEPFAVVQEGVRDPTPEYAPKAMAYPRCTAVFLWPRFTVEAIEGVHRYAIANAPNWALRGQPQRQSPSRAVSDRPAALIDRAYRSFLTGILRSDTLVCLAQKSSPQRTSM